MKDIIPFFDDSEKTEEEAPKTTSQDDQLGSMLQNRWNDWSIAKRQQEEIWLQDLRMFNQQNEPDQAQISKFHSHIYIGIARTKALSAYSRVVDIMFNSNDRHWGISPSPVPASELQNPDIAVFMDDMAARAGAMETEIADQMLDLDYERYVKSCVLESCILGTGVLKGITPGVKTMEKWESQTDELGNVEWDIAKIEIPTPELSAPSVFDIYPDPYADCTEDMSGVYERHVMNRQQFSALKDDPRFDEIKINEILDQNDRGNYVPLYHETDRRTIANVQDGATQTAERYDLLEYWGQVTGRMLISSGVDKDDIKESDTYWANVWVCTGKTLLSRIVPMKKQRIPYNFFIFNKVPHQFWGVGPVRQMRHSSNAMNGSIRSLLDGMAMAAVPMAEVNVGMLKDGQDPNKILPGMTWLRDAGDPSVPAVRFFQPQVPTTQLMQMTEMFKALSDDETALPAYTYGDQSNEINATAKGMSMQMSAAALPIKAVVKNLEDGAIRPLITSWFDWNMQWSDKDEIKGDMNVDVVGTSALMAKEVKSQQLMQFLNLTANPLDAPIVDRKYLLEQIAKSLEIDTKKAIPERPEEAPQQPEVNPVDQAKVGLITAQTRLAELNQDKVIAETAGLNVKTQFEAIQTAGQVLINPGTVAVGDDLMLSAGYKDHNGAPIANAPNQQPIIDNTRQNTSPQFPANPPSPEQIMPEQPDNPMMQPMPSPNQGIETGRMEGM